MSVIEILDALLLGPLKLIFEIIFSMALKLVGHPGLAIVALSLAMNILVLPLYRQADAMQEKARKTDDRLRDGINHIKSHFSGDERMMILQTYYRQNHYSPLSALNGSVSLLLEVPFFMAAYQFLSSLDALSGVAMGPITDLSAPDALIHIGTFTINFLPILMTLINVISSALYLKGFPLKTKVQLYAMAAFFLVFLYDSPAGLLLYWTLNNVFSLVKTIFYKLKNPGKVLSILCSILGFGVFAYVAFGYNRPSGRMFVVAFGMLLQIPILLPVLLKCFPQRTQVEKSDTHLFFLGASFLTVLLGLLIPTTFIAASPQEYISLTYFYHPIWYVVDTFCMAAGTFLIWMGVFYWLATPGGKVFFSRIVWILCGVLLVNYMFFGTDLGNLASTLQYDRYPDGLRFSLRRQLTNLAVIFILSIILYFVAVKIPKKIVPFLLIALLATGGMSCFNISKVDAGIQQFTARGGENAVSNFQLSKKGKNVIVFMLDRAMGEYLPYFLAENPDLAEQFSGFTYYKNVVSHGGYTNFGSPAMMGGYEYTPVEMNKRSTELLKDKHNEATLLLPLLFNNAGYDVTVCDPPYANYQWIPDLSIFDDYSNIHAFNTEGMFHDLEEIQEEIQDRSRNFFCFSLMKTMPLTIQPFIYDKGNYNQLDTTITTSPYTSPQSMTSLHESTGVGRYFRSLYKILTMLPYMTEISNKDANTYLFMSNNTTHTPQLFQLPDYTLEQNVDNTPYASMYENGITLDGVTLKMETPDHITHYHVNMAALRQLGKWFDYLRENGVYDNTRIILVSDHGKDLMQIDDLIMGDHSVELFYPLLMVKDFYSQEFTTSDIFMTNADVPYLATEGLLENPTNPFTGKPISMEEKTAHDQFVILSDAWDTEANNGTVFLESQWASVRDNIWDAGNWTFYDEVTVLKEHSAP